ncbi:MAG: HEAT repeat domain-containing protein [Bacillota bacterium]
MISLLYFIIFLLVAFVLATLIFILIYHFKDIIYEKRLEKKSENWDKLLDKYLKNEISLELISKKLPRDYFYLYDFFKPYLKEFEEENFKKIKRLIEEINMNDYFLKKLKNANRKKKIKAAVFLGKIGDKRALPYFKKYIYSDDELIRTASVWAISEIGELELYLTVLKVVLEKTSMTFEALTELSINFGRNICFKVIDLVEKYLEDKIDFKEEMAVGNYEIISLFIDILGYYRFKRSQEVIKKILLGEKKYYNDELLIHIFKALVKLEVDLGIDLKEFLNHSNWVIRSQTARYIGKIKNNSYVAELVELLKDEKWWVRYYAAEALFKIGKKDLLEKFAKSDKKRSEISNYILDLHN